MIGNKKKTYIIIGAVVIVLLLGITYALFNYTRTGGANTLVVGDVYFNHTEGDAINLTRVFPMTKDEARASNSNKIAFQVTGLNESDRDIYYKLILVYGNNIEGKTRIQDDLLRFDLVEIKANNEEKYIVYNESFSNINNQILVKDRIDANTTSNVTRNYELRMWVSDDIIVSDSDSNHDYTTSEWNNIFASVKVKVEGKMENVKYYDTLANAVSAVNSGSYTSTLSRSEAKLGIYTDSFDNSTNLVLYDDVDATTNSIITRPVDFNLYGYTINAHYVSSTSLLFIFSSDSIFENGTIDMVDSDSGFYVCVINTSSSEVILNNLNMPYVNDSTPHVLQASGTGVITVKNSNIEKSQNHSYTGGTLNIINSNIVGNFMTTDGSKINITDSDIENSYYEFGALIDNCSTCEMTVTNSTIFADSPGCYGDDNTGEFMYHSIGIINGGTLIFNSGYVFGTHSAVETAPGSKTYVYGGTFESTHHGGFYFFQGPDGVAYIENANIRGVSYPARGQYRPNGVAEQSKTNGSNVYNLGEYKTAFYIGGGTEQNDEIVYMVNCNISAEEPSIFVMRYSTPRQSLYMSGCKTKSAANNPFIRLDEINTKLYSGKNNDFSVAKFRNSSSQYFTYAEAVQNGKIIETNTDYKDIVRPE